MDSYLKRAFAEAYEEDGLTVMGHGLGIDRLLARFLQYYCTRCAALSAKPANTSDAPIPLVLVLNTSGSEAPLQDLLFSYGLPPNHLPRLLTNEVTSAERVALYAGGGVFYVTSRILIVDLLDGKLLPSRISGILVADAHRVSETSIDSFVIRVYREGNRSGFLKAFTDDPESISSGFGRVDRLLRTLFIRRLFLWPRFRLEVSQALAPSSADNNTDGSMSNSEFTELSLTLTTRMRAVQSAILVAMNTCLTELRKSCPTLDTSGLTLENGLFHSFDRVLRSQLDADWHKVSYRTKQLVNDVAMLRKLLDYLVRYDAFWFYYLLLQVRAASHEQLHPPLWLTSEAAHNVFKYAKERVYVMGKPTGSCHWYKTPDSKSLADEVYRKLHLEHVLEPVLESPPKWRVLGDIIRELCAEMKKHSKETMPSSGAATESTSNHKQPEVNSSKSKEVQTPTTTPSMSTSLPRQRVDQRILLIVRDDMSRNQLRDVLIHGPQHVMDQRFRWFVSQQAADIRRRANKRKQRTNTSKPSAAKAAAVSAGEEEEFALNDAVVQRLLGINADGEAELPEEQTTGFLNLGLGEYQIKSLTTDHQLLLIQERMLRLTSPLPSRQSANSKCAEEISASAVKRTRYDECGHWLGDGVGNNLACSLLDSGLLNIITHRQFAERPTLLEDQRPDVVILYDADVVTVRRLEFYAAARQRTIPIKIYFLSYEGSTEEHRYVGQLAKEKRAFEALIATKETLVVSLPDDPRLLQRELAADALSDARSSRSIQQNLSTTVRGIVVDVREFRSSLPVLLHASSFHLLPRTLHVGDYVLSPTICVERKGISDLFSSLASGRLYNQADAMCRYYRHACLLIEFSPDKAFGLVAPTEVTPEIQSNSVTSKLVLLLLTFPLLRILWSRSPETTAEIFRSLIGSHDEVDADRAALIGSGEGAEENDGLGGDAEYTARLAANEILLSLPGINAQNVHSVRNAVDSIADLAQLPESRLASLIGPVNAQKLYTFFRQRIE